MKKKRIKIYHVFKTLNLCPTKHYTQKSKPGTPELYLTSKLQKKT
jgi:hypothetical protein